MSQRYRRALGPSPGRLPAALVAAALAAALAPSPAVAQDAGDSEASDEARTEARTHYRRGTRLLDRNRPEDALEEFAASYALYPHWATSNSMGVCHDRLNRPSEAFRLYQQALREGGDEIPERQRGEIDQRVAALRIQLGIPEVTTGRIRINSIPVGGIASLDGEVLGPTPVEAEADPGVHRVEVTREGHRPNGVDVTVVVGETAHVALALEEEIREPMGSLACESLPGGSRVLVDGADIGRTPAELVELAAGEHLVRFETDDGRVYEERVVVPVDGTARVTVDFGGGVSSAWFWSTAGAALALGVGAAATGTYGRILWDEFNDGGTSLARMEEIQPTGRTLMLTTDVLAAAAGACALTAAILGFFTDFGGEGTGSVVYEGPLAGPPDVGEPEPAEPDLPTFPDDESVVSAP